MMNTSIAQDSTLSSATRFARLFIIIHVIAWTLGPWLARDSLPHDTLEGITWGLQWELGYNKHPFVCAWLLGLITRGSHMVDLLIDLPIYCVAQLSIAITLITVWRLAKHFLTPIAAIVAALSLDGCLFYNINSFVLTPDTLQLPLWALTSLCFYHALTTQTIRYWLSTAVLVTLCLMTKYQGILLLMGMSCVGCLHPIGRQSIRSIGFYCGIALLTLLSLPHIFWLIHHHFITWHYASSAASQYTLESSRVHYSINYILNVTGNVAGIFLLLWPFYRLKRPSTLSHFQWLFLLCLGLGPFLITLVLCMITGNYAPPRWSTPYFSLWGIGLLAWINPEITSWTWRSFIWTLTIVSTLLWSIRIGSMYWHPRERSDAYLPNKIIARTVDMVWHRYSALPLPYLAGSHYLIASVLPYLPAPSSTRPYLNWDKKHSPWINDADIKRQGAIFLWDNDYQYAWDDSHHDKHLSFTDLQKRYPGLKDCGYYTFPRTHTNMKPIKVGVALLMPYDTALYPENPSPLDKMNINCTSHTTLPP